MILSPVKIVLSSFLVISSLGIVIIKLAVNEEKTHSPELVSSNNQFDDELIEDNLSNHTPILCPIYIVEKSEHKVTEGSNKDKQTKQRWNATNVLQKVKNRQAFLNELRNGIDSGFVSDVESKGCKGNAKKIYVYQNNKNKRWIYSEDLQRKDGLSELNIDESLVKEI